MTTVLVMFAARREKRFMLGTIFAQLGHEVVNQLLTQSREAEEAGAKGWG